jgi:hypothetical protein
MDQGALVREQIEAGNSFLHEFEKSVPVVVAFWMKDGEEDRFVLYVASDSFNDGNLGKAYREVSRIAREMGDPLFDPFRVNLVRLKEPLVQAAIESYTTHAPRIPFRIQQQDFGGRYIQEVYLVKGPTGEYTMPSGREVLDRIIDEEAAFYKQHGKPPRKMKLPVLMAYDLAKCGREVLGELSGQVFKDGISVFEKEGVHGMSVEIVRDRNAALEFE